MTAISQAEFEQLARDHVPFVGALGIQVDSLEAGRATLRMPFREDFIRPGGTVSGPVQMALADLVMYAVVLSLIGRVELAVTTNLTCNFLRRPKPAALLGKGQILKLGKRLAVGEILLYSEGEAEPVAHVTCTYSIPPVSGEPVVIG
ncbi:MAG: PaaI family thioesterase [Gammaproteobacteria bacterium]|nr:PaaI family thioesterase [Gammaproteobacteria bacterium]